MKNEKKLEGEKKKQVSREEPVQGEKRNCAPASVFASDVRDCGWRTEEVRWGGEA